MKLKFLLMVPKNPLSRINSQGGQTLIGVLIALGITGILLLIISAISSQQTQNLKGFVQKTETIDIIQPMTLALSNPDVCDWQLSGALTTGGATTIDTTSLNPDGTLINQLNLGVVYSGPKPIPGNPPGPFIAQAATALPNSVTSVKVDKVLFKNMRPVGIVGSNFQISGIVEVSFDPTSLARPLAPVHVSKTLKATGPAGSMQIVGCVNGVAPQTLSCIDVPSAPCQSGSGINTCTNPLPAVPGTWTLVGGGCSAGTTTGNGRLLQYSGPNAAGTQWFCQDADNSSSDGSYLVATGRYCQSTIAGVNLVCGQTTTTCAVGAASYGTCTTGAVPGGSVLVSGGCSTSPLPRFLTTSAPDPTGTMWTCGDHDFNTAAAGSLVSTAVYCKSSSAANALNCSGASSGFPTIKASQTTATLPAPSGTVITGGGCSYFNTAGNPAKALQAQGTSGGSSVCANKDSGVASGGSNTIYSIGCGF